MFEPAADRETSDDDVMGGGATRAGAPTPRRGAPHRGPRRPTPTRVMLLLAVLLGLAACSSDSGADRTSREVEATTTTTLPAAEVHATVTDGATDVPIDAPVGISVEHGTLDEVTLALGEGATFAPEPDGGVTNSERTGWLGPTNLAPRSPYRIVAEVTGADGVSKTHQWTFTTGEPTVELHTTLNVGDGSVYGVGMPVIVTLNTAIPEELRSAVTDRMTVTADKPVTGGWRWFTDSEVHYRTAEFWPAHTNVSLAIDFAGLDLGGGVWGVDGRTVNFSIGDAHVSVVDAAAHTMTVSVNGAAVKTVPVSTGRPTATSETRSGTHVVNEKAEMVVMDSSTVGIPIDSPEGYLIEAEWAVRISNSGEFVHSAPWSVDAQGRANVSNGCVNLAPDNAKWFYDLTQRGDVVTVINTGRHLEPWNGYGDWQVPWDQWVN